MKTNNKKDGSEMTKDQRMKSVDRALLKTVRLTGDRKITFTLEGHFAPMNIDEENQVFLAADLEERNENGVMEITATRLE